jgi:hypothetical protein
MIGIQYMVVQREDTTGMGTILLAEVYQVHRVKAGVIQNRSRIILSDKVKLYEVVGPHVKTCLWILMHSIYK